MSKNFYGIIATREDVIKSIEALKYLLNECETISPDFNYYGPDILEAFEKSFKDTYYGKYVSPDYMAADCIGFCEGGYWTLFNMLRGYTEKIILTKLDESIKSNLDSLAILVNTVLAPSRDGIGFELFGSALN